MRFTVGAMLGCIAILGGNVAAEEAPKVLSYTVKNIDGEKVDLSQYKGKVLLIVNVASRCGLTPQYKGLQAMHEKYKDDGLAILGFPCNQFGRQEPGTEEEIKEFCTSKYDVDFDMFAKVNVNDKPDEPQADLYKYLTSKDAVGDKAGPISWNFEKFLVGRDGKIQRFSPRTTPDDEELVKAIEAELAK